MNYALSFVISVFLISATSAIADPQPQHGGGLDSEQQPVQPKTLAEQVGDLSHQVSELQAKIKERGVDAAAMKANGDERRLGMSMGTSGRAPQGLVMPPNTQAGPAQAPQMGMMAGMMPMMNSMMGGMTGGAPMGQAASIGSSTFLSVLPGFPGASHLYHIGSTNFFLDHPEHITLSLEQQSGLAEIRTKALMRRADFNRKIQEVEEQIWLLTASDQPNFGSIEAKIRETEKLQGDSRLAFIKDVGEAAKILTDDQRKALLGDFAPSGNASSVTTTAQPQAMGDM